MSLLMDALKKAEREREAQASKEQGESQDAPQELSLDPMERVPSDDDAGLDLPETEEEPWDILGEGDGPDHGFDLNLSDVDLESDAPEPPEPPEPAPRETPDALQDAPLSADVGEEISLDGTSSTMPSMKAVKASVDRYFDGTQSGSMSMDAPLPATEQDDTNPVVRTRDSEQARAAARTVFDAKNRRKRKGWIWIPVGLLLFLLVIGGFISAYFNSYGGQIGSIQDLIAIFTGEPGATASTGGQGGSTMQTTTGSVTSIETQTVATDSATDGSGTAAAAVGETTSTETSGTDAELSLASLEPELSEVIEIDPPPIGDLTPVEAQLDVAPEEALEPAVAEPILSAEELLASADEQISAALADESALTASSIQDEGFQVTRGTPAPSINSNVLSGYEAFQRNDFASAERDYRTVLRTEPNNRDALLGLAAIAIKKDRIGLAAQIYGEILRVDPRDSIAQSALMALKSNPTTASESQLKLMLEREPDAGHLHFGLGNYYASQARWAEAQNFYFNSFRLDTDNPDYAYNLAVGLDHLSQPEAALKYYRLALELAVSQAPGFEPMVVQKRIESITQ